MPDITGKINTKKLGNTGMDDEAMLRDLWANPGKFGIAIVEYQAKQPHGPNTEGNRAVDLVLTLVEPARDEETAERIRELMRAMYQDRRTASGEQPALDGTTLSLEDARTGVTAAVERDDDGNPVGVWDGDQDAERAKGDETAEEPCPFPGCKLGSQHDGDHDPAPADDVAKKRATKKAATKKASTPDA